ncbi:MAG: nucleoside recognition domain-containing protein [Faecousia sp.]
MSWVWAVLLGASVLCAAMTGRGQMLSAGVMQGAQAGVTLAISISGSLCLWAGVGRLMEKTGLTAALARLLRPVMERLFPATRQDKQLAGALSANICANFLGLGNAATPPGIEAARRLAAGCNGRASDELCRLIVLNTASIQLIPANVAAVRSGLGCASPFDILPAVWAASLCSAGMGVAMAWLLGRLTRHD